MPTSNDRTYPDLKKTALIVVFVIIAVTAGQWLVPKIFTEGINSNAQFVEEPRGLHAIAAGLATSTSTPMGDAGTLFQSRSRAWLREHHPKVSMTRGDMSPIVQESSQVAYWQIRYKLSNERGTTFTAHYCLDASGQKISC